MFYSDFSIFAIFVRKIEKSKNNLEGVNYEETFIFINHNCWNNPYTLYIINFPCPAQHHQLHSQDLHRLQQAQLLPALADDGAGKPQRFRMHHWRK